MLKKLLSFSLLILLFSCSNTTEKDFTTRFEKSKGTETPTYSNVISFYKKLAKAYNEISVFEIGKTDSGKPLHLTVFNAEGNIDITKIATSPKNRILINNGIHPGESDGIDASMLLLRNIVQNDSLKKLYKNTLICIIPVYNVGGALNRNSHTRANQNGPKEYGFRGNARNFDLNRDFIKQDTKNASAFSEIFHIVNPDVFIDNHVSNGADYQYAITHLFTQHNKLGGKLGVFLETQMRPFLEQSLQQKNIPITPYVNVWGTTPDKGWSQFMDSPRYSTGYTTLFNTFGMMVETHMLKPYKTRVEQTYELMFSMFDFTIQHSKELKELRANAKKDILNRKTYPIAYKVVKENPTIFNFKGYEGEYINSKVTNGKRLFYNKNKSYERDVKYYNNFTVTKEVNIPKAYIIPKGWYNVIEELKKNKIQFTSFRRDTIMNVTVNHINNFKTVQSPFEGHYLHYNTSVNTSTDNVKFSAGDIIVDTNQNGIRYLLETLEAEAVDSFFNWNFFDTILQRKEGFSGYVFEDIAAQFLKDNTLIKAEFDTKMKADTSFAKSTRAQLNWVYKKTPHYEKAHMRLPIFKVF